MKISSRENSRIKHLRKLISDKTYRYENMEYAAEGMHALENINEAKELFICDGTPLPQLKASKTYTVDKPIFNSISSTEHSQGIVAIVKMNLKSGSSLRKDERYVLLDRLQDPGNMGTIIRSACAFTIRGIILTPGCVDAFSPKVTRAAAGALAKVDIINIENLNEIAGFNIIASNLKGKDASLFNWPESFILAIGNEAAGVSGELLSMAGTSVSIPISGCVESLNAAVAAGILFYQSTKKNHA